MKCSARVGFVLFTRACLKNKYVRHEIGQREKNEDVEKVSNDYFNAKKELKDNRFRVDGIFDVHITTATSVKRKEREQDQTAVLLQRKGAFSASAIYTNIGTMCVSCPSVTKAQIMQLKHELKEKVQVQQKKKSGSDKKLESARVAVAKHRNW